MKRLFSLPLSELWLHASLAMMGVSILIGIITWEYSFVIVCQLCAIWMIGVSLYFKGEEE